MIVVSIPAVFVNPFVAAGLFAGGWALQFAGHFLFERNSRLIYVIIIAIFWPPGSVKISGKLARCSVS